MANHKSAEKRIRQSEKRRRRNQHVKGSMKTAVKKLKQSLDGSDDAQVLELYRAAERTIRRAASKGVIPGRRADRTVGRLAKRVHARSQA